MFSNRKSIIDRCTPLLRGVNLTIFLLASVFSAVALQLGEGRNIYGTVRNAQSGDPIAGAVVILRGTALQTLTDEQGRFSLVNSERKDGPNYGVIPPSGVYTLEVRAKDYQPSFLHDLSLADGELEIEVKLEPGHQTNFVQVGPSNRYFCLEDGTPYFPAGFHHQIVEPEFNAAWNPGFGKWWTYRPERAEKFAADIARRGITLIRIFLEEAYILETNSRWALFQDPVGVYRPDVVTHWDQLFDWADKYGFKILVSLYHTDQARRNWEHYPYAEQQGGPAGANPDARWFTDPEVRRAQRRDLAYIIDRWGQRDSFFGIDLMNEADAWPAPATVLRQWVEEMAGYARGLMVKRWGKAHLLTVSSADYSGGGRPDIFINNETLDFVNTHMYFGRIANPQIKVEGKIKTDVFTPALEANFAAQIVLETMFHPKPYFDSEHGPIRARLPLDQFYLVDGIPSPLVDEIYFHNIIWANFVAGAAGAPTRWGFRPNTPDGYRLTDRMLDDLGRLRKFALRFDLHAFAPKTIPIEDFRTSTERLVAMGCADAGQGMVWLLQRRDPIPGPDPTLLRKAWVEVPVPSDGHFQVEFYRPWIGKNEPGPRVQSKGKKLRLTLPDFDTDLAVRFWREEQG